MRCPFCGREMEHGFLQSGRTAFFTTKRRRFLFWTDEQKRGRGADAAQLDQPHRPGLDLPLLQKGRHRLRRDPVTRNKSQQRKNGGASMLYEYKDLQSRAANGENQRGEKGQGGMARGGRKGCPSISPMRAGKTYTLLDAQGSGMVRHIWCTFPARRSQDSCATSSCACTGTAQAQPSVEVPLGDFFGPAARRGAATCRASTCRSTAARPTTAGFPCPSARARASRWENDSGMDVQHLFYQVDYTLGDEIPENACYFHAQFRRQNPCPIARGLRNPSARAAGACTWARCWACAPSTPRAGGAKGR